MSLLSPLWLGLAAAAAVPILLHLLRRRHGARVDFPAVRFVVQAEQEQRQETRLRHLVLLAARVLAVLLMALAAARPVSAVLGGGHAPTALAIVLDNSLASASAPGGAPVLATLAAAARQLLDGTAETDRVWLLTADGQVVAGAAAVRSALATVTPLAGRGDLPRAITRAAAIVREGERAATHVVVVSDGRRSAFPVPAALEDTPLTLLVPPVPTAPNRAVTAADPVHARWGPWGSLRVAVRSADSADLRVVLAGQTVARATLPPGGEAVLRARAPETGWLAGHVELAPDDLRGDDVRHFAVSAGPPPAVRVDASAGPFAAGAVASLVAVDQLRAGGSIVVLSAERLTARPAVIVAPTSAVLRGAANRSLAAAAVPWRVGALRNDTARAEGATLTGLLVRERYVLESVGRDTGRVLARVGGQPWIVAGEGYVLVGSPLTAEASDLPVSAPFVPWLAQVVQTYLVSDGGRILSVAPGAPLELPPDVDALLAPDGSTRPVTTAMRQAPDAVGVYWLRRAGRSVGAVVVNPEPDATDPTPLLVPSAVALQADGPLRRVASGTEAATQALSSRAPCSAVALVLVLLLLVLIVEGWLIRPPRRTVT